MLDFLGDLDVPNYVPTAPVMDDSAVVTTPPEDRKSMVDNFGAPMVVGSFGPATAVGTVLEEGTDEDGLGESDDTKLYGGEEAEEELKKVQEVVLSTRMGSVRAEGGEDKPVFVLTPAGPEPPSPTAASTPSPTLPSVAERFSLASNQASERFGQFAQYMRQASSRLPSFRELDVPAPPSPTAKEAAASEPAPPKVEESTSSPAVKAESDLEDVPF